VGGSADTYVDLAHDADRGIDLLYLVAVWTSLWYWFPLLGLTLIFAPLLFPDGRRRPAGGRWSEPPAPCSCSSFFSRPSGNG
jgi:hypothetical protein